MCFKVPTKIVFIIEDNLSMSAQVYLLDQQNTKLERDNFLIRYLKSDYPTWSEPKQEYIDFINNTPHWTVSAIEVIDTPSNNINKEFIAVS